MSRITVDPLAKTIEVDDYIYLHSATDFVIRNATARNFALTVSTHQGIILFRVDNFVDDGTGLNYRTNLESDGLLKAFRHVPKSGCRRFLLNVHDRNASFSVQFSGEIMVWNDIASSMDMSAYALKTELFSGNYSDLTGAPDLSVYALKTELPTIPDLSVYALKTELFSGNYSDLTGAPDLSVYALKTELPTIPDLSVYALKTELFSGNYSDLTGAPDLSVYALKTELPTIPDLSVYALKTEVGLQGPQGAAAISFAVLTAVTDEATFAGTAQLVNADGTAGETVNIVYDFAVPASGE